MKKRLAILGSTGSIGTQTLQVVSEHPDLYEVRVLTAFKQADALIEQAIRFEPDAVVIADETLYNKVREGLANKTVKVFCGTKALVDVVQMDCIDTVVTATVGFSGLEPTIAALKAGKQIALANKETLVVAGELITALSVENNAPILPVDSEHSAISQCLVGENPGNIDKLLLTASGGPFRLLDSAALADVTAKDALQHPTWQMGDKITIDSATMMNKGFEVIEAKWLFGVEPDKIEVLIHPQSIVHSAVQMRDGSVKAQLGLPDMRLPIQYALSFPDRLDLSGARLDLFAIGALTFERPDLNRFPCLALAYEAIGRGGNMPCVLNAANEVCNLAFRENRIKFPQISEIIEQTMQRIDFEAAPTLETLLLTDRESRNVANEILISYQ
ncbi:MAG: 1-deoxy-D-xylulose-5-phosphate reductoisomerase [Prevotellaceae bacterium]|nr:1-deoxy-D-xylulose-5-phosphate reductoisomerase [Prevotellaceae bacterium]